MMNTEFQAQAEILSILTNKPEYFKNTILQDCYFTHDFRKLYSAMYKCFYKFNGIVLEHIAEEFNNINLIENIVYASYTDNETRFKALESFLIESYRKRNAELVCDDFLNRKIEFSDLCNKINEIKELKSVKIQKLTKETLAKTLEKKSKQIDIPKFPKLSNILKLCNNDFVVIGARTGAGKSAFALNLLASLSAHYPCVYLNLEIAEEQIHNRLLAIHSGLFVANIEKYNEQDIKVKYIIEQAKEKIAEKDISLLTGSFSLEKVKAVLSSLNKSDHTIVFIDHLLLIKAKAENRYEKVTEIAMQLRALSLDFNVTIIAICQLSRFQKEKEFEIPTLSTLKDSGEIENSASKVLFLHEDKNKNFSLIVAKNRTGTTATIDLFFDKQRQIISEKIKV